MGVFVWLRKDEMKKIFLINLSVLMCVFVGVSDAMASPCPAGCFCLNNGESVFAGYQSVINSCYQSATIGHYGPNVGREYCGVWVGGSVMENMDYYYDEFSVFYEGDFGFYGFIDNEFVYGNHCNNIVTNQSFPSKLDVFQCPVSHPHSAIGAKALTECYKYDANGNKVYYGANTNIVCAEGNYLPANATQCIACNATQNQVCPGGRFEKSDKIQGLKLNCSPGQYLPANATQCSTCDENNYFCFGGIYDFNSTEDQGLIVHNGYVNMSQHSFITCNAGQYVPANTNQCTDCKRVGNYACPGGIFFTGTSYNFDRGITFCRYGNPKSAHTSCNAQSSKPSFMKEKVEKIIDKNDNKTDVVSEHRKDKKTSFSELLAEKKLDLAKSAVPLNRSVTQRAEFVSEESIGKETVSRKPVVNRAAKAMPRISTSTQDEVVRDRPGPKRRSKYK